MVARIPAHVREQQINELPNIRFVRWADAYFGKNSKAVCRCSVCGYEWANSVDSILNAGRGCAHCSRKRRWTADERIAQINQIPNISFIRWCNGYKNSHSKAICRCEVDGHEWVATAANLINNRHGCPVCGRRANHDAARAPEYVVIDNINALPNISFVRWCNGYKNNASKAICRCEVGGHEWDVSVSSLLNNGTGCPKCASYGFNPGKPATLYILRSECGKMVKIGISNNHEQRHGQLRRATPFDWHCIELLHSDDGSLIAEFEKELHSWTEQIVFSDSFHGFTEWRKWDDRLPMWLKRYRARLERYNKAP